jgi:hypothetical protein
LSRPTSKAWAWDRMDLVDLRVGAAEPPHGESIERAKPEEAA